MCVWLANATDGKGGSIILHAEYVGYLLTIQRYTRFILHESDFIIIYYVTIEW